jgi:hypothetical protein
MNNKVSLEDILFTIQEWKIQASSGHNDGCNDGWGIQGYKEKLQILREHLENKKEPRVIT